MNEQEKIELLEQENKVLKEELGEFHQSETYRYVVRPVWRVLDWIKLVKQTIRDFGEFIHNLFNRSWWLRQRINIASIVSYSPQKYQIRFLNRSKKVVSVRLTVRVKVGKGSIIEFYNREYQLLPELPEEVEVQLDQSPVLITAYLFDLHHRIIDKASLKPKNLL